MTNSEPLHEDKRQSQEEQAVQRLSELRVIAAAIRESQMTG